MKFRRRWKISSPCLDQMVADGNTPWCIGVESGNATGWTATDWMEDLMLRTAAPEKYDQWVSNELPFNSPEVLNAMKVYGQFSRNDDYVAGGSAAVATTSSATRRRDLLVAAEMHDASSGLLHSGLLPGEGQGS